jgi:uncharacterized 2Fe-2S/4Fe-4S cluster protein (DUF4445 family)
MITKVDISVLPHDRRLTVAAGGNLFFHLAEAGISLNQACGGQGVCGKCRVRLAGRIPSPSDLDEKFLSSEDIAAGFRLACGVIPAGGEIVELFVPASEPSAKSQLGAAAFAVDPWPGLEPSDLVLAVDVGTTTVVGHLLDPVSGRVIHSAVTANGQTAFGADVVTRLAYASHGGWEARLRLQALAFDNLRNIAAALTMEERRIRHVVAVMNTAMESCLLNWDPDCIGRYPIQPETKDPLHLAIHHKVEELKDAELHLPAIIGGFVGSDTVGALLASRNLPLKPPYLLMDIGTNAEVALIESEGISACSCAAGPAFEGGGISQGMRAMEGAISRVRVDRKQIDIDVIGGGEARGITGSGMISLAGELLHTGALDRFGMIQPDRLAPDMIVEDNQGRRLRLTSRVSVSENDIQQLMLAKAAARAGSEVLLSKSGLRPQELTGVILSGTFANSLCAEDVLVVGLIPPVKPDIIYSKGNAAAEGACMMACSRTAFDEAIAMAKRTHHIRLSGDPDFNRIFQENVSFEK